MSCLVLTVELAALGGSWALLGWQLLPGHVRARLDPALRWTSALALGAGVTAVMLTALAALHMFSRGSVRLLVVLEGVSALTIAAIHRRELRDEVGVRSSAVGLRKAALVVLGLIVLLTFIATCAPPSAMDATVYHLRVPAEFLRAGTWTRLDVPQSFQPLYVEMLFAEGLVLGGGPLAALVHWLLGIAAIGAAASWARRFGGSAVWGALVFGGTALWVWESTSAFIDLGLALFASLSLLYALSAELGVVGAVLGGIFAGLAGGSKFTGLVLAGMSAGAAFARAWPDRRRAVRSSLVLGGVALLVASPWYVRNLLLTGNPIFPLANKMFGLRPEPLATITYGLGTDPLHLLSSPFDLLARGDKFDQGWSIGPAYLALAPIGLCIRRSRESFLTAAYATLWWLVWFYSSPQTRLLIPILPAGAGLAAVALDHLLVSRRLAVRAATVGILAVAICGALAAAIFYLHTNGPVVFGRESPDAYLRRNSWNYSLYKLTEGLVPKDARVAVTGGANNLYYFDHPARWLGTEPVSTGELAAAGFDYELRMLRCPLAPLDDARRTIVREGTYPLRASRLTGGVFAQVCFRLSTVSPSAAASTR